jgi:hypothetical protein
MQSKIEQANNVAAIGGDAVDVQLVTDIKLSLKTRWSCSSIIGAGC